MNYAGLHIEEMQAKDVIMSYKGAPSQDLLNSILTIAEVKLSVIEQKAKIKKKVYHILVEALQNIYHHFDEEVFNVSLEAGAIVFILARKDDGYVIVTGNHVPSDEVITLKGHIDRINKMDREEIRKFYRQQLHGGELSEKGGAGLGILDIARRSGQRLDYDFKDSDNGSSFFSLKVKISA